MNQFLANSFSKLIGIFAAILLFAIFMVGVFATSQSVLYGFGIVIFGFIATILIFGALAVILSQYEETKAIRVLLQSNQNKE
jgi:hypothetical protein